MVHASYFIPKAGQRLIICPPRIKQFDLRSACFDNIFCVKKPVSKINRFNLINSSSQNQKGVRTQFLQKYFHCLIIYRATLINENNIIF